MSLSVSEVIALFSLGVAVFAYRHSVGAAQRNSRQIEEIASNQMRLSSSIAMGEASQKYVALLSDVNREFEGMVKKLSHAALMATTNICSTLDEFDTDRTAHPRLRHALHDCVEIVRQAYDQELSYQTGANLAFRLRSLKSIKDDIAAYESPKGMDSIFSFLRQQPRPSRPEELIHGSALFRNSLKTLYKRIPADREAMLFTQVVPHIKEFVELHSEYRDRLRALELQLDEAIKENSLEMFKICNVPGLGPEFYRVKGDICRISNLYFPDLYRAEEIAEHIQDGVAHSLYVASTLFIVSQHFMWGKI
ncbi:hypothetical protein J2Y88_001829 [Pseudomonas chlororaphis]|uniref:hypothetical protein n=1 Tax=Pseudomonas chlororaphis TaxID=587753 RepID=UPI0020A19BFB|nr:hypothetical protein [Pseudomonas chlororaphis]MCP1479518.1 hypothetical protein [Pseudomonas chlororaphis]MCP1594130.1 hypothetical protein [Pseudomonas chlororaphis]